MDEPLTPGTSSPALGGRTLGPRGRYVVERELGAGGMGAVLLALDRELNRQVALKLIRCRHQDSPEMVARLRREGQVLASLSHPRLVRIFELDFDAGQPFLVMEQLQGEDLELRLQRGPLEPTAAVRLACELADALAYLHANRVLHRDLKPANVFLERGESLKLLDFGLALPLDLTRLTAEGSLLGTPLFLAPECACGAEHSAASEVYQAGLIVHQAATGRLPYADHERPAALLASLLGGRPPVAQVSADLDPGLAGALQRCLAADPAQRPPDGAALARLLQPLMEAGAPRSSPDSRGKAEPVGSPLPSGPGPRARLGAGAAVVLGLGSALGLLWSARPEPRAQAPPPSSPAAPCLEGLRVRVGLDGALFSRLPEVGRRVQVVAEAPERESVEAVGPASGPLRLRLPPAYRHGSFRWRLAAGPSTLATGEAVAGVTLRALPPVEQADGPLGAEPLRVRCAMARVGDFLVVPTRRERLRVLRPLPTARGTVFEPSGAWSDDALGPSFRVRRLFPTGDGRSVVALGNTPAEHFALRLAVPWEGAGQPEWFVRRPGQRNVIEALPAPDGQFYVVAVEEQREVPEHATRLEVALVDGATGAWRVLAAWSCHRLVAASGDGTGVAVASDAGGCVSLRWVTATDTRLLSAELPAAFRTSSAAAAADGTLLFASGTAGLLLEPAAGAPPSTRLVPLPLQPGTVPGATLAAPDGSFLFAAYSDFGPGGLRAASRLTLLRLEPRSGRATAVRPLPQCLPRTKELCLRSGLLAAEGLVIVAVGIQVLVLRDTPNLEFLGEWQAPGLFAQGPLELVDGCVIGCCLDGALAGFDLLGSPPRGRP